MTLNRTQLTSNRPVQTQSFPSDTSEILAKQRLVRPVAPHLSIYKPQITWIASGLNRITGVAIAAPMYLFFIAYAASGVLGWHLESTVLATSFAAWPAAAKIAAKFTIAMPFTFHSFNGLRHLIWDTGKMFGKTQVIRSGWIAVGVSTVAAAYLAVGI
jgi:succinate dehydrogenase (ubiquinone) cytochrome b560 subunit